MRRHSRQVGRGVGSILSLAIKPLTRMFTRPVMKSIAKSVAKNAASTGIEMGKQVVSDVISGKDVKESLKTNGLANAKKLSKKSLEDIRTIVKRERDDERKNSKTKAPKKKQSETNQTYNDIFD